MAVREPQQEDADQYDHRPARGLELRCAAPIGKGAVDDREARQHEHEGKADMSQRQVTGPDRISASSLCLVSSPKRRSASHCA